MLVTATAIRSLCDRALSGLGTGHVVSSIITVLLVWDVEILQTIDPTLLVAGVGKAHLCSLSHLALHVGVESMQANELQLQLILFTSQLHRSIAFLDEASNERR